MCAEWSNIHNAKRLCYHGWWQCGLNDNLDGGGMRGFGNTCSNSISPRWCARTNFIASTRSCPKLGFFEDWLIPLPVCRNRRLSFVTRIVTQPSSELTKLTDFCCCSRVLDTAQQLHNCQRSPQLHELRRHLRSSALTASHTTRPIHT